MYIKIYFGDKPVFLCNEIDDTIHEYMHHPDAVFIHEITGPAIKSLLHEIAKEEQLIRKDPLARSSDLLQKVFGK